MNEDLIHTFEKVASQPPFELNLTKWTCPKHYSELPGLYCKQDTSLAWKMFNAGYELGKACH